MTNFMNTSTRIGHKKLKDGNLLHADSEANFLGAGKCIVEFEKMGTAVMEDVGTFMIKVVRLGDLSNQVLIYSPVQKNSKLDFSS